MCNLSEKCVLRHNFSSRGIIFFKKSEISRLNVPSSQVECRCTASEIIPALILLWCQIFHPWKQNPSRWQQSLDVQPIKCHWFPAKTGPNILAPYVSTTAAIVLAVSCNHRLLSFSSLDLILEQWWYIIPSVVQDKFGKSQVQVSRLLWLVGGLGNKLVTLGVSLSFVPIWCLKQTRYRCVNSVFRQTDAQILKELGGM